MQNRPDPATPIHERRWLDRLRAAWDEVRARPTNKTKAGELAAVAQERPGEAKYRIDTFVADAARRASPAHEEPKPDSLEPEPDGSDRAGRRSTPDSDRFDDEAGR